MENLLKDLKKDLKDENLKLSIKTYSDFKAGTIKNTQGESMPSIFTTQDLKKWQSAIYIKEKYRGKIRINGYSLIL